MMMIAGDFVLHGRVVTKFDADVVGIVFADLLSTDTVKTTELVVRVAMWLGETVVTLKRDVGGSLYSFNTLVFVKMYVSQEKLKSPNQKTV